MILLPTLPGILYAQYQAGKGIFARFYPEKCRVCGKLRLCSGYENLATRPGNSGEIKTG